MRSVGTLLLAFFLSLFVAGMIQTQLAIWFRSDMEFIAAVLLFVLATLSTTIILGIALFAGASIDRTAGWVAAIVVLISAGLAVWAVAAQGVPQAMRGDLPILIEIVAPTLVMIVIQWWLIRRRVLRVARDSVTARAH